MIEIAVIDDGVNSEYFPIIGKLSFDLYVNRKGMLIERKRYNKKRNSHGTVCTAIIKKYATNAKVGSIKVISDSTQRGKALDLVTALNYCYENKNIKVVHMSLGSRELKDLDIIAKAVNVLVNDGRVVVSALTNTMKYSIPACNDMVFGVKTDIGLHNDDYYIKQCGLCDVPFIASSNHVLADYRNELYATPNCNSYAAPVITANILNILSDNNRLNTLDLMKHFKIDYEKSFEDKLILTKLESQKCDIPIIAVQAFESVDIIGFVDMLSVNMLKIGYPCKMISISQNVKVCTIDNCVGVFKHNEIENLFAFYQDKMEISSIILITDENYDTEYDINITFMRNVSRNAYRDSTIIVPQKFTLSNIVNAIRYIEKQSDGS